MMGRIEMRIIKRLVLRIYHGMQHHYWSFRVLVWLKECGITRRINYYVGHFPGRNAKENPTEEMKQSRDFYETNRKRIADMLNLLSDEKSEMVWGRVMNYRINRETIPEDLYSENDQYFCRNIIKIEDGEVFLDGGAYTGDTIQQFMDTCKREKVQYKKIVAFEPDKNNFMLLSKFYGKRKEIMLFDKGLSKEADILYFQEEGVSSRLSEQGTVRIPVVNIDGVPECRDVTFIKMDIEGAEMDALYGAKETIKRNRPKLAVCIYHSDEDMVRITEYIHSLVPEYRLYVRHHSRSAVETVVYAVTDR